MLKSIFRTFFPSPSRDRLQPDAAPAMNVPDGATISYVLTSHGSRMAFDPEKHALVHYKSAVDTSLFDIFALRHRADPSLVIILSLDYDFARPFRLETRGDRSHLRDIATQLYMSANPTECLALINVDREQADGWEQFELLPLEMPGHSLARYVAPFWNIFTASPSAQGLLDNLFAPQQPAAMLRCYADMLDLGQCREFNRLSEHRSEISKLLAEVYRDDPWAQVAMPLLTQWLTSRQSSTAPDTVGTEFDFLASDFDLAAASFTKKINTLRRQSVTPRKKACVLATARNEGVYIVDWIAHHIALGFEHFFIYSNNNEDCSDDLLRSLVQSGLVTFINNEVSVGVPPQIKAYAHAMQIDPRILDYEWVAVIDLDEFVHLKKDRFATIGDYVDWQASLGLESVGLNWAIMLPGQKGRWTDEPVAVRFPEAFADIHVKSIFKPRYFVSSHCHVPNRLCGDVRAFGTADGTPCERSSFNTDPTFENAWVAHYYYKSAEEFLDRRTKNRGDHPVMLDADEGMISTDAAVAFLEAFERPGSLTLPESSPSSHNIVSARASIFALPDIEDCMARILAQYRLNLDAMRHRLAVSPRFQDPESPEGRLYTLTLPESGDVIPTSID